MPWFINNDKTATCEPFDTPEYEMRVKLGENYYGTLAGAVIHEGVQASAFDSAIEAEPIFDAEIWFKTGENVHVGYVSDYRICATPERGLIHPPIPRSRLENK